MSEKKDYKDSLNLPNTNFPMKGNLQQREPEQLKIWDEQELYKKVLEKNAKKPRYILHDGPPYANGEIHMGHALNKILKDIVVRYKNMTGFSSPYVPGWDCHGLPIEHQVEKKFGKTANLEETFKRCRDYAKNFVDKQKQGFIRLGVYGDWDHPYLTMSKGYEASIINEFAKIVRKDAVYREDKPVSWCAKCETALAEAEVEYADHESTSVYVKFECSAELRNKLGLKDSDGKAYIIIWTTTPWTLPANLAISLHPDFVYGLYNNKKNNELWFVAEELFPKFVAEIKEKEEHFTKIKTFVGKELDNQIAKHPFYDRDSKILIGDHVTLETGTGCVHTAPGHGIEDYVIGKKYGLEIYNPVDNKGFFLKDMALFGGLNVKDANSKIVEHLKNIGHLIFTSKYKHSYPHCWRCKSPIIFRATPQWFISMSKTGLRYKALKEIEKVKWVPERGMKRIYSMIENRPDWCISRQRKWGVPIVYFTCPECQHTIMNADLIDHVATIVAHEGIEAWHKKTAAELLPEGFKCDSCGNKTLEKGHDILDVWFDSGVSHTAVCGQRKELHLPADLYLEGSDQHRGWFHTAMLTSVLTRDEAPYKKVVTHGFIVDKGGYKMSKSQGNGVDPIDLVKKSGADILRLWVLHEDFSDDISYSDETYERVTEAYRRIRNTWRFILGNISDFNPQDNGVSYEELRAVDKWLINKLHALVRDVRAAYESFEFHKIFHLIHNFCVVELSSFYLDISKDNLYTLGKNSQERRCIQTVIYDVLDHMLRLLAPVLVFTTEEAWLCFNKESIHLADLPDFDNSYIKPELDEKWAKIFELRNNVSKSLEDMRKDKTIGHSLDASIKITLTKELSSLVQEFNIDLESIFIVSNVEIQHGSETTIVITKAEGNKCARCWKYKQEVGKNTNNMELCEKCSKAII